MTLYAKINSVVRIKFSREVKGRRVGMADEADSKSVVGNHVRVQVPLPALDYSNLNSCSIGNNLDYGCAKCKKKRWYRE